MIKALLALSLVPLPAVAWEWDVFERRCLVPMEEITPFDLDGLTDTGRTDTRLDGAVIFANPDDLFSIAALIDPTGREVCGLIPGRYGMSGKSEAAMTSWTNRAIRSGRYERLETSAHELRLRSVAWREPRMDVSIHIAPKGWAVFVAEETDLES
jgi:hypothetical protein